MTLAGRTYLQRIARDVSERHGRERELRLRSRMIEEAPVGITVADASDDELPLTDANPAFERITGYGCDRVVGRNCRFLQGDGTDEDALDEIRGALAAREPVTTELLNYRADGTPFRNELTVSPVTESGSDEVSHFVGFRRDVTSRRRRERLVGVLNRVLRHNLRNDMNVVEGYATTIADRATDDVAGMADRIAATAAGLVSLGDTARTLEEVSREPATPALRDVVPDVEAVADDGAEEYDVAVEVDAPGECRAVATDRLDLTLRELAENAVSHGSPPVRFHVERRGDRVAVGVTDEGPGLSATERRVLEAGHETPLEHGQGLCLRLVDWIVTDAGGAVTASEDGGTVTLLLPAEPSDVPDRRWQAAISTRA